MREGKKNMTRKSYHKRIQRKIRIRCGVAEETKLKHEKMQLRKVARNTEINMIRCQNRRQPWERDLSSTPRCS